MGKIFLFPKKTNSRVFSAIPASPREIGFLRDLPYRA